MGFGPDILGRISLWEWVALVTGWDIENEDPNKPPPPMSDAEFDEMMGI